MIQRGIATFTLDYGKCPKWLFDRMVMLGREMVRVIVAEEGPDAFIQRIGDPVWFQSLGTVLAFDWNASGLTTILTAALKEAIRGEERNLGIFICGGKGKTSRKTPDEIFTWGSRLALSEKNTRALSYNSRMAAKVDSALIQDGFQIYHHTFFFSVRKGACPHTKQKSRTISQDGKIKIDSDAHICDENCRSGVGAWTVVQQGMNKENQTARRYHWHSETAKDLIREPHSGISSQIKIPNVLNMTANESEKNREISADLTHQSFGILMKDIQLLRRYYSPLSKMVSLGNGQGKQLTLLELENKEFYPAQNGLQIKDNDTGKKEFWCGVKTHPVVMEDFSKSAYLEKILWKLCDEQPESYEKLLSTEGVGPKTIRALALVSEVIYGAKPSYEDPARYSFAHGGKDATPYPVDRKTYNITINTMKRYVEKTKISVQEKNKIQKRLAV